MNIKKIAEDLIKLYGLNDPLEIALGKGIIILEENLKNISGYSLKYKRQGIIHLNKNSSLMTKRIVCAHELGYLLIHPKEELHVLDNKNLKPKDDFERYAQIFAANLLIPDSLLEKHKGKTPSTIAKSLNLPLDLVLIKLKA